MPMTPDDFAGRMRALAIDYAGDKEIMHGKADDLLCELLSSLGYNDGVAVFENMDKWYA